jgi:hypothetical protein
MFFIYAGVFIGGTGSFSQAKIEQKNQWSLIDDLHALKEGEENNSLPDINTWLVDLLIGAEGRCGTYGLWSNSVGVVVGQLKWSGTTKTVLTKEGDIVRSRAQHPDAHTLWVDNNFLINGRSTAGLILKSCYFGAGVSFTTFQLLQKFNEEPVYSKWIWGVGPCLSFKVELKKSFRWVFYGDWWFFNNTERPKINWNELNVGDYELSINRKPFMWRVSTGFEIHGTDIKERECSCHKAEKPSYLKCARYADLDSEKQQRIEALRRKVLGKSSGCEK